MLQGLLGLFRRLVWPLIALGVLAGILVGLLLGWQVWPVRWYDTDPSDLREQHKMSYVIMAADSLAVTGNQELAKRRLSDLVDKRNTWEQVANLVERTASERERAGDSAAALRTRRLAQVAQLPSPKPTPTPAKSMSRSTRWLIFLVALGAFFVALAILLWFLAQRSRSRLTIPSVPPGGAREEPVSPAGTRWSPVMRQPATPRVSQTVAITPSEQPLEETPEYEEEEEEFIEEPELGEPQLTSTTPVQAAQPESMVVAESAIEEPQAGQPWEEEEEAEEIASLPPGASAVLPAARAPAAGSFTPLGTFEVEYNLGDDDLDRSFSIEAASGDFLGECGVGICDVLRVDTAQQVDAFEIWLFDKGDIRTVSKILVSEHAYQDEALKARLSGKGELVQAQPGLTMILQTLSLRVTATLKAFEYAADEQAPNSIFSRLQIELLAELNEPAS